MLGKQILVVDDEKLIRWSLRERLTSEGYEVAAAADGAEARNLVKERPFDLALLDLRLPDTDGVTLLREFRGIYPDLPVIIMTAYSTVDNAVEAMKCGAVNYLTKPFNMDELAISVRSAIETGALRGRVASQVSEEKRRFGLENIIGESKQMLAIKGLIGRVARSETTTVLLLGESGSGKDMLARAIHYESSRVDKPFVNITCTALPGNLLESELFGYEKGAFTGATTQKKGLFQFADGGTVFLDEIGDMAADLQAKLLRVLEDKCFKRLGGTGDVSVNVRVIAATNHDIDEDVRQGRFREDLYYRLSTMPILMPPLRERREDIPLLAGHFLHVYNGEFHRDFEALSPEALDKIKSYHWPGNVRELRNVIERATLLAAGREIQADDITLGRATAQGTPFRAKRVAVLPEQGCSLEDVEKDLIRQALERTCGNRTQAAELLGLTRDQVRYKISKHDIDA